MASELGGGSYRTSKGKELILKKLVHSWLPVLVAFLIGAMFVGVASAAGLIVRGTITAKNFKYLTPKTVNYPVPGSAFVDAFPGANVDHNDYSGQVNLAVGADAVAAINLPQGAVIKKLTVWTGTQTANDWVIHLEANKSTGGHDDMTILHAADCLATPCQTSATVFSPNTIDNVNRSYGLWLANTSGSATTTVYRVVIQYSTTAVGPVSGIASGTANVAGRTGTNGR